jgi:acetolactate synthase-1/2/3 large subunit
VSYTVSTAVLEAMRQAGARRVFANLGSDHSGFIEAYATPGAARGRLPELILCPHEFVALSAAHGYAQVSREPQAVLVHVDCGTQNLGGAVHNAARGRVPVLIFAGLTPATQDGELTGGRTEFIHWLQDTPDQRGIVRGYVKYENELRTPGGAALLVRRAMQIAASDPPGPVYLTATRELMEMPAPAPGPGEFFSPVAPAALTPEVADEIATALVKADAPLVVTSHLGRDPAAVAELVALAEAGAVPVLESVPKAVNFPADHPLHVGYQWHGGQNAELAAADVILVAGSDVPWIPLSSRPSETARIFVLDADPLRQDLPLWQVRGRRYAQCDLAVALRQVTGRLRELGGPDPCAARQRAARAGAAHETLAARLTAAERPPADGEAISAAYTVACVRDAVGPGALVLSEAVSSYQAVSEHLRRSRPGSLLLSGGGSLGWAGGAAVGAKLAAPEATVAAIVGDGTYLFGVPASWAWMARRYQAATLTVILDNEGWRTPALSAAAVRPGGHAARHFRASFSPAADLPGVAAAAGGALARTVTAAAGLPAALADALAAVRDGQAAVVSVRLAPV